MYNYRHKFDHNRTLLAVQVTSGNADEVAGWCGGTVVEMTDPLNANDKYVGLNVPTPNGNLRAVEGDYVVHDNDGDFHVRTGRIFEARYEREYAQDEALSFDEPQSPYDNPFANLERLGQPETPGNEYVSPPEDETPQYGNVE